MNAAIDTTPGPLADPLHHQVACSECGQLLAAGTIVRNVPIYKQLGELDTIEIVHEFCPKVGNGGCPQCGGHVETDPTAFTERTFISRQPLRGEQPEVKLVPAAISHCTRCEWTKVDQMGLGWPVTCFSGMLQAKGA